MNALARPLRIKSTSGLLQIHLHFVPPFPLRNGKHSSLVNAKMTVNHWLQNTSCRGYAAFPRPPPPPTEQPRVTTFSDTSRPRPYQLRDLPKLERRWPGILVASIFGIAGWVAFYTFMVNQERISSSIVRQALRTVRDDPGVKEVLGDAIRFVPEWWLNGDVWIRGSINMMQGNIDISYRIKGTKGAGTLYFTSVRRDKGLPFDVLRFKVIADDGTVVNVDPSTA